MVNNLQIRKKLEISILPPILCIQIKRFKDNGEKIMSTIRIDYLIDIKKYANIFYIIYNI